MWVWVAVGRFAIPRGHEVPTPLVLPLPLPDCWVLTTRHTINNTRGRFVRAGKYISSKRARAVCVCVLDGVARTSGPAAGKPTGWVCPRGLAFASLCGLGFFYTSGQPREVTQVRFTPNSKSNPAVPRAAHLITASG